MKILSHLSRTLNIWRYFRSHKLASKGLAGTVTRFVRWQTASRLLRAPVIWPWIGQSSLVVERGMTGATMNIYCGLHEFEDMAFVLHFLKEGENFVDVGANVGVYTVLASSVIGAKTLSVEPVPATFRKLNLNLAVNGIQDLVEAVCCGVGRCDGKVLSFIAHKDTMNRVAPSGYQGATVEVPIRTLDALLENFSAILWKIDVEGFEEEVLNGGLKALAHGDLQAVEIEGNSPAICDIMRAAGFKAYTYDPFERSLSVGVGERQGHNWLWLRDHENASKRCQGAVRRTVNGVTL